MIRRRLLGIGVAVVVAGTLVAPAARADAPAALVWSLSLSDVHQAAFDSPRSRVLVSGDSSVLEVDPTTGDETARVDTLPQATNLVQTDDPDTVWVSYRDGFAELALPAMRVVRTVSVPTEWCTDETAWAFDRLWVTSGCGPVHLGSFSTTAATPGFVTHDGDLTQDPAGSHIFAAVDGSRLYLSGGADAGRYEFGGGRLSLMATPPVEQGMSVQLMAWDDDGPSVLADALSGPVRLDPDTLHVSGPGPQGRGAVPDPNSDRVATASGGGLYVVDGQGVAIFQVSLWQLPTTEAGSLVWLPDHAIAVVGDSTGRSGTLLVQRDAARIPTYVTLHQDAASMLVYAGHALTLAGQFAADPYPGDTGLEGYRLEISRTVAGSTVNLGTVETGAAGRFTFTDDSPGGTSGSPPSYTVSFAGDTGLGPAAATATARTMAQPWDFNGDGYQDAVVSAPLKRVGTAKRAGMVTVLLGGPKGLSTAGATNWTQDSPGVPDKAETADQFGYATASADFDGDGFADLAVSANNEKVNYAHQGSVTLLRGSSTGLTTKRARRVTPGDAESPSYFGEALAVHPAVAALEQYPTLSIAAPGLGRVYAYAFQDSSREVGTFVSEDSPGVPGKEQRFGEGFGESLATGDFNGDGNDDTAIGIPYDYDVHKYSSGAVVVTYGGFRHRKAQRFTLDTAGIAGSAHRFSKKNASDQFGFSVAAGDLDGDGIDELMIGAPGTDVTVDGKRVIDAGQATVIPGSTTGLKPSMARRITKQSSGVVGRAHRGDYFGSNMVLMRDRASSKATAVIDEYGSQALHILPAGRGTGARRISQETAGVPGSTQGRDLWGYFVRSVHSHGFDAPADLLVSAPGEGGHGALTILPSTSTGPTGAGSKTWTLDTPGIPGAAKAGDLWGWLGSSH